MRQPARSAARSEGAETADERALPGVRARIPHPAFGYGTDALPTLQRRHQRETGADSVFSAIEGR
jgi:hypothetical protein